MPLLKLVYHECYDFYNIAFRLKGNAIVGSDRYTDSLTIGKTYGCVIAIYTYDYSNWTAQFFMPLGILNTILLLPLWMLMETSSWFSTFSLCITSCMSYVVVLSMAGIMQGVAHIYAGKRHPPSWKECTLNTYHFIRPLSLITFAIGIPFWLMVEGLMITSSLFYDYLPEYITDHFWLSIVFDLSILLACVYYCILFTIIVIPCIVFEQIQNPLQALSRSYQLTQGKRNILFVLFIMVLALWLLAEMLMDLLRTSMEGDYYYHDYASSPSLLGYLCNSLLRSIPGIVFVPFVAILQTVIYINLSHVHEIRTNILPSQSPTNMGHSTSNNNNGYNKRI